jgi:hypothetical protein
MTANVRITELPAAGAITGTELVPIVQNGVTVRTTTGAVAASPSQTQTFLTKNQEPTLANSRYLSTDTGLGLTDGGAQSYYRISLNGASGSLEAASNGIIVKTGASTVVARQIAISGSGLSITDDTGVSGNPTIALSGMAAAFANLSGSGMVFISGGTTAGTRAITGTASQIDVANGTGVAGAPTISLSSNPIIPGTGAMTIPIGSTAQQPVGTNGQFRFNSDTQTFDGYASGSWRQFALSGGVTSFSAGATGLTPGTATTGAITLNGILIGANGGTGVANTGKTITLGGSLTLSGAHDLTLTQTGATNVTLPTTGTLATLAGSETLTNKTINGSNNTLSNIANASLTNSSITINGSSVSLGGSVTVTATASNALTIGTGLSGTSYNGSTPVTIAISNTGVSAATYGSASIVPVIAVNAQGQITSATDTSIAIAASQVTSGTLAVAQGGTNLASYTAGDLLYASATTTLSKLALGTQGYVLRAGATAPEWAAVDGGIFT